MQSDNSLDFNVNLNNFNGSLEILLDLAKSQKVDLEQISITKLADQFHQYLTEKENLNLEIASEYLLMATWLTYLKSKLLLPETDEDEFKALEVAEKLKNIIESQGNAFIFKASFDKANRSSIDSYRGPGLDKGLETFKELKKNGYKLITDVHEINQVEKISEVVDIIQIPAFLCRQTDLIKEACQVGKPLNIKKGQFLSPDR